MVGRDPFSPSFGPDGRTLYFHGGRERSALMRGTFTGDAVTGVVRLLDDGASNYHAQASPDGRLIAFDSDRDGERGVYVSRVDGGGAVRISGGGHAAVPSWSPDGRRVAFVKAERGRSRVWNIWIAQVDGGSPTRVTNARVGQPWGASWFPDGHRIAYSREQHLVILDLATGLERRFRSPLANHLVRTPSVSPDGARIVFQVHKDGVWVFDVASRRMRRVWDDRTAEEFGWSPDGHAVVFHARRRGEWGVWTLPAL
jgi:Tol biopolymer transport system component